MPKLDKTFLLRLSSADLKRLQLLAGESSPDGAGAYIRRLLAESWKSAPLEVRWKHSVVADDRQLQLFV
jgi:hypothetical protein